MLDSLYIFYFDLKVYVAGYCTLNSIAHRLRLVTTYEPFAYLLSCYVFQLFMQITYLGVTNNPVKA
jgi:hypothetical protein